ncbi:hypothetical protein LptCag_0266 [Leptospirillum ferriphilum]|uniref:Uncharacterized protein n=1 Tax=Leptospirillum ferriphilum TaxID=178606 RepID=A0A094W9P1_9BACT|nr:hypothetical protein LptCag_0266 [Leptospirillum ferriphilum]
MDMLSVIRNSLEKSGMGSGTSLFPETKGGARKRGEPF